MQTKIVQSFRPEELKAEIDLIITADAPTFIHVIEMLSARGSYIICWV